MEPNPLVGLIQGTLSKVRIEPAASVDRITTVYVAPGDLTEVAGALHDHPDLAFTFLAELTAADFWPGEPRFEVVYLMVSIAHRRRLRVKVRLRGDAARVPTVSAVWPAANWLEREVWDLFGIAFEGHPDPRRLLMPEDWEGYPLRKDYPVQIRKAAPVFEPLQLTEEEFRANVLKDRLARE